MSYPPSYEPGSRGLIAPMPGTMTTAVRLMYAGAAYALVYAIAFIAIASSVIKNHPDGTLANTGLAGVAASVIVLSLVEIALWLMVAHGCQNRRKSFRITGTVLFGIHTLGALSVLANSQSGIGLVKALTIIGWLIGCGAVVFLWRKPSNEYFATPNRVNQASLRQ